MCSLAQILQRFSSCMSSSRLSLRRFLGSSAGAFGVLLLLLLLLWVGLAGDRRQGHGELFLGELDLKDGVLFLKDTTITFNGTLVENYTSTQRKLEIQIRDGRADGLSRGFYDNGQIEVEESFQKGVSHGLRTRWHANGVKKSEATIVNGVINGRFMQWYENGVKAAEVPIKAGLAHGLARSWYPSGALKSRVPYKEGEAGDVAFFPDDNPLVAVDPS